MASYTKVIVLGNLTRDPELRTTTGGTQVCELGLAVNRKTKEKETTSFIDVKLWGRTAEIAGQYLAKGRSVLVEGRLEQESWEDKATGQKRSKLVVVGEAMQMISDGSRGERQQAPAAPAGSKTRSPADSFYDPPGIPDGPDDTPF